MCLSFDVELNRLVFHSLAPNGVPLRNTIPFEFRDAACAKRVRKALVVLTNAGKLIEGRYVSILQLREQRALEGLLSGEISDDDVTVKFSHTSIEITLKGESQALGIGRLEYGVLSHQLVFRSQSGEIVRTIPVGGVVAAETDSGDPGHHQTNGRRAKRPSGVGTAWSYR